MIDGSQMAVLLPLSLALLAAPLALIAGLLRPRWSAAVAVLLSAGVFGALLWGWLAGGGSLDIPWAPSWDLRLSFHLDGLAAMYALLASGIGLLVLIYSSRYLPLHLEHEGLPETALVRFNTLMLLFLGSMVGLVMAQDLILIFLFWDLTAVASYFLIGFDSHKAESRASALMALLVTGISALLFLVGALVLYAGYGTFALPELIRQARPGFALAGSVGLMALAALAKSAQAPFHFWLPRAMAAPTPVSAYLHSAAMVAAGVFLIGRLYPLLSLSRPLLDALLVIGLLSTAIGGILALTSSVLKHILAYSTIAQYGYVVFMFGLGGREGVAGATFYVIAHAVIKSALFLTAGAVSEATGETQLARLGGLARRMPLLAVSSAAAAAGLAALPLTVGFFKDELFFDAALAHGLPYGIAAGLIAAITLAYIWRWWSGIFLGREKSSPHPIPAMLLAPVAVLGGLVVATGIFPGPVDRLAEAASSISLGRPVQVEIAYHLDARPANLLALFEYAAGIFLVFTRPAYERVFHLAAQAGARWGPERWYRGVLKTSHHLSRWIYRFEVRDLAGRVSTILIPTAILMSAGILATPTQGAYRAGSVRLDDLPLLLTLLLTAFTAVIIAVPRRQLIQVLALSTTGYSLAAVYALFGSPNVALVSVLVGTLSNLLLLGLLALFPRQALQAHAALPSRRWGNVLVAVVAGVFAFLVAWATFSQPSSQESMMTEYVILTPEAHAGDIVTAILADFRGLDTLGEITVIGIVLVGVGSLLATRNLGKR